MNAKSLLDQLLRSGQSMLNERGRSGSGLGGMGGGALAGGALAMLLGSRSGRKLGGAALKYGSLAALGALAYRAYNDWQQQQSAGGSLRAHAEPQTVDRLPAPQVEAHSRAILAALVAAAKADGHIDVRERGLIEDELGKLDNDPATRQWLHDELEKPLDPAEVARLGDSPELASEMYLASRLMVDQQNFMERTYLDELARCLKLDPDLRTRLDAQIDAG